MLPIIRILALGLVGLLTTIIFICDYLDDSQERMLDSSRVTREILAQQFASEIDQFLAERNLPSLDLSPELRERLTKIIAQQYFSDSYQDLTPLALVLSLGSPQGDVYMVRRLPSSLMGEAPDSPDDQCAKGAWSWFWGPRGEEAFRSTKQLANLPLKLSLSQSPVEFYQHWQRSVLPAASVGLGFSLLILLLTRQAVRCQRLQNVEMKSLREQACRDSLTDLYNRRYAERQAQLEIKKAQRSGGDLAIILLDLDHFKAINDSFGHVTGDQALVSTARILKEVCRETDLVCRFGGEEFLLVLPGTALSGAQVIAEKVRVAIESNVYSCENQKFQITASFGVSQWNSAETDFLDVLRRADAALYEVKSNGRNQIKVVKAGDSCLNSSRTTRLYWDLDRV